MNPIYFVVVIVFLAVGYMVSQSMARKSAGNVKEFLAQHPDAVKIYLMGKFSIASEAVVVATVDGELPVLFTEGGSFGIPGLPGGKSGLYVLPGTRTLELQYTHNRPGIMYKNVTTSTGLVKKEFVVEAGKTYVLGFDRKNENFTFETSV
ncbi:MAG: hypothetical protein LBG07_01085 [Treponema sp.]|jgi:hypothetical protein|nr:hypothetical protein [Treponema sp.]